MTRECFWKIMKIKAVLPPLIAAFGIFSLPLGASLERGERVELIVETSGSPESCAELVGTRFPDSRVGYVYDTLLCGFSIELYESQLFMLESFDFIEGFSECGSYESLSTESFESLSTAPGEMIGLDSAREAGLDGSGTIVAVIDSGFDIDHTAFSLEPGQVKLSKSYLKTLASSLRLAASRYGISIDELFYSDKLPFVFDYAEGDGDVSSSTDHGTHVAGIIGAERLGPRGVEGIAPKCQLIMLKIFDENNSTSDSILLAALEDAVKLGADVINLSLGRYSGSAETQMINGIDKLFERAEEYGVTIVCAAGNESNAAARAENEYALPPASYTDYGTVSYPASAKYTLSVGSIDSPAIWGQYFLLGNERIYYSDTNKMSGVVNSSFALSLKGSHGLAIIPGIGEAADYEGINVKGKIVLVERGEMTFVEKTEVAASHGAIGVIICNNVEKESINLELTGAPIPAISISKEDGERIKASQQRSVSFSPDYIVAEREGGGLSSFSSVGATPSLTLAPDICGVGGGVYSSINDGYGGLSGTSMASPQLAGVCALLCQKYGGSVLPKERVKLLTEILMNTAEPITAENGVEYSPRAQGAGLVNIENALGRELSMTVGKKPKAELYDLCGELFYITLTLKNLTDSQLELSLGATLTSDGYVLHDGVYYSTLTAEADRLSVISANGSGNINLYSEPCEPLSLTLSPRESRDIELCFELDADYDAKLSEIFTNGRFLEGYIKCSANGREYSLPYMGYSSDWAEGSILDLPSGDPEAVFGGRAIVTDVSGIFIDAGTNFFTSEPTEKRIAFSPDKNGAGDTLWLRSELLRNVSGGELKVYDSDKNIVCSTSLYSYQVKSAGAAETRGIMLGWDGSDGMNHDYILPDGEYTLEYTFTLDFYKQTQTYSYNVLLDTKKPTLDAVSYDPEKRLLTLSASDDDCLQYIKLTDSDRDDFKTVSATNDKTLTVELELSEFDGDKVYVEVVDGAYNSTVECFRLSELTA